MAWIDISTKMDISIVGDRSNFAMIAIIGTDDDLLALQKFKTFKVKNE